MSRRIRVLLLAEACNPAWTSTPLQAFMWFRSLCAEADVTLVTQARNREGFVNALGSVPDNMHFIDTERIAAPVYRLSERLTGDEGALGAGTIALIPSYYYFEWLVWHRFKHVLRKGAFDLVHRLTPSTPVIPSWLASRLPVPFVIGPLIGSLPWPDGHENLRRAEGRWTTLSRGCAQLLPCWRQTYTRAAAVLLGTRHSSSLVGRLCGDRQVYLPWNGVDDSTGGHLGRADRRPELHLLFVGRMIPLKQPALIVDALAQSAISPQSVRLTFVGRGTEESRVREIAEKRGLATQVQMKGWLPHQEIPALYRGADLLVLPSIHESGGAVLLEAMACGLPCAVVDYGGPGEYVRADVGFKIPLGSYEDMVSAFARLFQQAFRERGALAAMGARCRSYVLERFDWRAKARRLVGVYEEVISSYREPACSGLEDSASAPVRTGPRQGALCWRPLPRISRLSDFLSESHRVRPGSCAVKSVTAADSRAQRCR